MPAQHMHAVKVVVSEMLSCKYICSHGADLFGISVNRHAAVYEVCQILEIVKHSIWTLGAWMTAIWTVTAWMTAGRMHACSELGIVLHWSGAAHKLQHELTKGPYVHAAIGRVG